MDDDVDGGTPEWKLKEPAATVTTILGSSKCHCFSTSFIKLYGRFISDINSSMCFVDEGGKPCANESAGGAHVKSVGTVMILPACAAHNKANSDEKYDVRKEYLEGNFGLVLKCCCYNTKGLGCKCQECKREVHKVCQCRPVSGELRANCNCE